MNNVYGKPMPLNVYEKNETMKILGRQRLADAFWYNDKIRKGIDEIAKARPCSFTINAAADIFALGYIYGKRAERARRHKGVKK